MVKWNIQAIIYKTIHRQLNIGQYETNKATLGVNSDAPEDKSSCSTSGNRCVTLACLKNLCEVMKDDRRIHWGE